MLHNIVLLIVLIVRISSVHCSTCEQLQAGKNSAHHYPYETTPPRLSSLVQQLSNLSSAAHACTMHQLLGANSTEGYFMHVDGTHVAYEPHSCWVRRLSAGAARQCLDGKFVAFIGDSVTRYQYLSFAYFLAHMQHLPRYHGLQKPHMNDMRTWKKKQWNAFMHETSQQIMDEAAPGASVHESCDCSRHDGQNQNDTSSFREFRRLCITQQGLPDGRACANTTSLPSATLKLGYQQAMKHPSWYEAPLRALAALLQEQPLPDVAILNAGLWAWKEHEPCALDEYRILLGNATAMAAMHGVKLIWRTTTAGVTLTPLRMQLHKAQVLAAQEVGVPILDVYTMGRPAAEEGRYSELLYIDSSHPAAFFYQEINDVILNVLCDDQCAWTGDQLGHTK